MIQDLRAKVFISCGQRKDTDEVHIAQEIAACLEAKGFETYIAVQQQSPKGLKENIFEELSSSEYFLFIDFKREQLVGGETHRGSLFSHQELGIASFLDMPLAAFQEAGVKTDDGILQVLQANCEPFSDRHTLAHVVADKIEIAGWKPNWKNQLAIEREPGQFMDALRLPEEKTTRFYHVTVRNLNPHKHARNCYAFLEKVRDLATKESFQPECIEFKWAGYVLPNATVLPGSYRYFDGFFVFHDSPSTPYFNLFSDSGLFVPRIKGPGDYELTYLVISDNFTSVRATLRMHLADELEETRLEGDVVSINK